METIDILTIVDSLDNLLLIDVLGQWQLNDESVDIVVLVQFINTCQKLCLCDISLEADQCALKTTSLAGQHLVLYISLRATIMTHQYGCQMGLLATLINNLFYFFSNLGLYGRCCCFSVN